MICFHLKEQNKFATKFGLLDKEKVKVAQTQSTNREILTSRIEAHKKYSVN